MMQRDHPYFKKEAKNRITLMEILNIYSDCTYCGAVISDPELMKQGPFNPGKFRAVCPKCRKESSRVPFLPQAIRQVFEIIDECIKLEKPTLFITLVCTAYEVLLDDFIFRLLERNNCPYDICYAVINSTEYRSKTKLIEEITGKKIENLAKEMEFDGYFDSLQNLKEKRNKFIHKGIVHKKIEEKVGKYALPKEVELDEADMKQAISFAEDTIHFFAKIYTKYGEWQPLVDE